MSSAYTVDGLDLDLQEALAAAVDAARKAGRIIWDAAQRRRVAVAAAYAPSSLPSKSTTNDDTVNTDDVPTDDGGSGSARPTESPALAEYSAGEAKRAETAAKAVSDLLRIETKTAANDLVTYYDKRCDAVIQSILQQYVDRVNRQQPPSALQTSGNTNGDHDDNSSIDGGLPVSEGATTATATAPTAAAAAADGQDTENKVHTFRFITEELNPDNALTDDLTWIVDPIDGTLSFVHGLPDCCVSIGLTHKKECILAVVFCPFLATSTTGVMQVAHTKEALGNPTVPTPPAALSPPSQPSPSSTTSPFPSASISKRVIPQPPGPTNGAGTQAASTVNPIGTPAAMAVAISEEAGVVECVGELYAAIKGKGVYVNGVPVRVNAEATTKTAMATLNFPYGVPFSEEEEREVASAATDGERTQKRQTMREAKMARAIDAVGEIRREMSLDMLPGVRAYGSCVTTLALIAAGHIDLYLEPAGKIWDVVCGSLLIREAGGCVKNMVGKPFDMSRDTTIAAGATEALVDYITGLCVKHRLHEVYLGS